MIEGKDFAVTSDDFRSSEWEQVIQPVTPKAVGFYSSAFSQAAKETDNQSVKLIFQLFSIITFSPLNLDSPVPVPNIDFLSDQDLDFLAEILGEVDDAELKSRIADILWLKRPSSNYADAALSAYLEAAKILENVDQGVHTIQRLERALGIAARTKKDKQPIIDYLVETLDKLGDADNTYFSAELMENLISLKTGDFAKYAAHCEQIARRAEINHDYDKARRYLDTQCSWNKLAGDDAAARQSNLNYAATFEKQSAYALETHSSPYTMAAHFLELAIEAYRRAGRTTEKVNELRYRLRELQRETGDEMITIPGALTDIRQEVQAVVDAVTGKSLKEAIFLLTRVCSSDKVSQLEAAARRTLASPLNKILPYKVQASDGRIQAIQSTDEVQALEEIKFFLARTGRSYNVNAFIHPARETVLLEHSVRIRSFYPFLVDNLLVRNGREYIIAEGLYAGLTGDFITATHLLIPQIEESLRGLMIRFGLATATFEDSGVQNELNLNQFLKDDKFAAHLKQIFGEDFIFDLRGLLVERFGENLRNDMAHGLLNQYELSNDTAVYLWWLALRFYVLLHLNVARYTEENGISDK